MIPLLKARRVTYDKDGKVLVKDFEGYYLTIDEIVTLCRNFGTDCFDGFVSNDRAYIEQKLKEME